MLRSGVVLACMLGLASCSGDGGPAAATEGETDTSPGGSSSSASSGVQSGPTSPTDPTEASGTSGDPASSGNTLPTTTTNDPTTATATTTASESGSESSGSGGEEEDFIAWEVLLEDGFPAGIAAGPELVFVLHDRLSLLGIDASGTEVFDIDLLALFPGEGFGAIEESVVARDDGTAIVQLDRHLIAIDETGAVEWIVTPNVFTQTGTLSHPALGADGTIYVTLQFGQGSNYELPHLVAVDADGTQLWFEELASDAERLATGIPPLAGMPTVGADQNIWVVAGVGANGALRRISPTTPGVTSFALSSGVPISLFGVYPNSGNLIPMADGGFLLGGTPPDVFIDCGGPQNRVARVSNTGTTVWTMDYRAEQYAPPPVTGRGDDLLLPWGDCGDGNGAGLHVATTSGNVTDTADTLYGDGVLAVATANDTVYVVEQDADSGQGTSVGPIVHAIDRTTLVDTAQYVLPCIDTPSLDDESLPRLTVASDGSLVVACLGIGTGQGGVYGLTLKAELQGHWPLTHGTNRGQRRF